MPGLIHGKVLRSPHPHARIRSIDTSKAEALPGVRAVVTAADFPILEDQPINYAEIRGSARMLAENVMARKKALYAGHAVAAVAADSPHEAEEALAHIEVDLRGPAHRPHPRRGTEGRRPAPPRGAHDTVDLGLPCQGRRHRQAEQHLVSHPIQGRRPRRGLRRSRHHDRARVHHAVRASGLHRAARLDGVVGARRPDHGVDLDAGGVLNTLRDRADPGLARGPGGRSSPWRSAAVSAGSWTPTSTPSRRSSPARAAGR